MMEVTGSDKGGKRVALWELVCSSSGSCYKWEQRKELGFTGQQSTVSFSRGRGMCVKSFDLITGAGPAASQDQNETTGYQMVLKVRIILGFCLFFSV